MTHDARKPTIQPLYILCRVFKFTDVPEIDYVSYQFRHLANPDARQLVILEWKPESLHIGYPQRGWGATTRCDVDWGGAWAYLSRISDIAPTAKRSRQD